MDGEGAEKMGPRNTLFFYLCAGYSSGEKTYRALPKMTVFQAVFCMCVIWQFKQGSSGFLPKNGTLADFHEKINFLNSKTNLEVGRFFLNV